MSLNNMQLRVIAFVLTVAFAAYGEQFETFVEVEDEEDLLELLTTEQISQESYDTLIDLLLRGVDINTATRRELFALPNLTLADVDAILQLRAANGKFSDPGQLIAYSAISERKFLSIAPFLSISRKRIGGMKGWVDFQTVSTGRREGQLPPAALRARAKGKNLTVGLAGTFAREGIKGIAYDPLRDELSALPAGERVEFGKAYALWESDNFEAIVGTYRIGFGQRLVMDNTGQTLPNGFRLDDTVFRSTDLARSCTQAAGELSVGPCDDKRNDYWAPDFRVRQGFLGGAVGVPKLKMGSGWLKLYAFGSYQSKDIYQYELYDRGRCSDPDNDNDPQCAAPQIFNRENGQLAQSSRFSFETLQDIYVETVAGGHVAYYANDRTHVGATGYLSGISWRPEGIDLDFQEWSALPYGGNFGAVGVDIAHGIGLWDIGLEAAKSFDNTPTEGGFGVVARAIRTNKKNTTEITARFYDQDFSNPYGRPIAAPDEYFGNRARDEAGVRARYINQQKRHSYRLTLDTWVQPSVEAPKLLAEVYGSYKVRDDWQLAGWLQYQNKDLRNGGKDECFSVTFDINDETGETIPCRGQKLRTILRARYSPSKRIAVALQAQHSAQDDESSMTKLRQDVIGIASLIVRPSDVFRFRGRLRYKREAIDDNQRLAENIWSFMEGVYQPSKAHTLSFRYDTVLHLDERAATILREPSPEHRFRLAYRWKF